MLKPVTLRVTATVCALPTVEPLLSVAAMVIVPVYVPGLMFTADALTPREKPAPVYVPEVAVSTSQELLGDACHATGRAQVPLSLNPTGSVLELVCPSASVKPSVVGLGVESRQGGRTMIVTVKVCVLPCIVTPFASLAVIVTVVL
jgi:hypothetical protein